MDLGVRELLIIVGVLLATAVLLDGFRRMRREREGTLRISAKRRDDDDELINPELPSGSARVVAVREQPSLHLRRADSAAPPVPKPADNIEEASETEAEVVSRAEPVSDSQKQEQPLQGNVEHDILFTDPAEQLSPKSVVADKPAEALPSGVAASEKPRQKAQSEVSSARGIEQRMTEAVKTKSSSSNKKDASPAPAAFQELLVLNAVADEGKPYKGADLLQVLLGCDLRYGRMKIFHRHEHANGAGAEQFSVANLVEPGNFELDGIEDFATPGVVFFLELPGPENSLKAFEAMLETAHCLVTNLGGELRDQSHSVATKQTLEHYKQRIRDFERRQMTLV